MSECRNVVAWCEELRWSTPAWSHGARQAFVMRLMSARRLFDSHVSPDEMIETRVVELVHYRCRVCWQDWDQPSTECFAPHMDHRSCVRGAWELSERRHVEIEGQLYREWRGP